MALIQCGECGKEVSDKAASCPGCGAPIAQISVEDQVKEHVGVEEVIIRDRMAVEGEKLGYYLVVYFPVLVAFFAAFYIPYRFAMAMGWGDDLQSMPTWIGIISMGLALAALVLGKFIRGRNGWIATGIFVVWFIFSPDFVSQGEQAERTDTNRIKNLSLLANEINRCKKTIGVVAEQKTLSPQDMEALVARCDDTEVRFLQAVEAATDEQISAICATDFRLNKGPIVERACVGRGH